MGELLDEIFCVLDKSQFPTQAKTVEARKWPDDYADQVLSPLADRPRTRLSIRL